MTVNFTTDAILLALLLFSLRVLNIAISTVRLVIVTRQQRVLASALGFIEALIFAVTMATVVTDLTNLLNLFAYCGGFAVGNYVGMAIESRFITSYMTVNVFAPTLGHEIAMALRDAGFGVTETIGEGRDGQVTMLKSIVTNREVPMLLNIVQSKYPEAFIAIDQSRAVQRGYIGAPHRILPEDTRG